MELFIERSGAGTNALQTCHALSALFDCELLHNGKFPSYFYDDPIIHSLSQNGK